MNCGILIYAHNNEIINYVELAVVAARLSKENLKHPVCLVTDAESKDSVNDLSIFDHLVIIEKPSSSNKRSSNGQVTSFLNSNRNTAWNLSPFDQTLMIDADYFVFTNKLNEFWDVDQDFLISNNSNFFLDNSKYLDNYISYQGIPMRWATTIMFNKSKKSKLYFDLVEVIKNEYHYFNLLYNFNNRLYRNDISFSIADHILNGHMSIPSYYLPTINAMPIESKIIQIDKNLGVTAFINTDRDPYIINVKGSDIHFMNKEDLIHNINKL